MDYERTYCRYQIERFKTALHIVPHGYYEARAFPRVGPVRFSDVFFVTNHRGQNNVTNKVVKRHQRYHRDAQREMNEAGLITEVYIS